MNIEINKYGWDVKERKHKDIIDQILINRGVDLKNKRKFLNPDWGRDLHDPFLMKGMDEAVGRIEYAINHKEIIGIFGDYDADGIPGVALIKDVLERHKIHTEVYIPARVEGYGLNEKGIEYFEKKGVTLIITVDLGVTGRNEINIAKEKGIDTIVTDHHEIQDSMFPLRAIAVIDPKQKDCQYPFKELCGAAVAYKLALALVKRTKKIEIQQMKWYLDLVGISTIVDMVPLIGENRVLAKYGLIVLEKTKRIGLKHLYKVADVEAKKMTPYLVGFVIGPRINAPGRVGEYNDSLDLLLTRDEKTAEMIAKKVDGLNRERQELLKKILQEAEKMVMKNGLHEKKIILVDGEGWPDGIIGLVAGRLTERYGKPSIVIGRGKKLSKGSARSIEGLHLVEMLNECEEYLVKHGGHAKAAGLTVETKYLEVLYEKLLEVVERKLKGKELVKKITCDAEIPFEKVNWNLFKKLRELEPYGLGNNRPTFLSEGAVVKDVSVVGKGGAHLKLRIVDSNDRYPQGAIGFEMGDLKNKLKPDDILDILYTIDEDSWSGKEKIQLKLLDLRFSRKVKDDEK